MGLLTAGPALLRGPAGEGWSRGSLPERLAAARRLAGAAKSPVEANVCGVRLQAAALEATRVGDTGIAAATFQRLALGARLRAVVTNLTPAPARKR